MLRRLYLQFHARAYVLLATLCGCAGVQRAADDLGEKGTAAGAGTLAGALVWFLGPVGWVGGALSALTGALVALLVGGGDKTVHEAPTPLGAYIAFAVVGALLLRSWAHWLPPLLEVLKNTAKGAPRALLGGRPKKAPAKFVRRID